METNKKAFAIIQKLKPHLVNNKVFDCNINYYLNREDIKYKDFYTFFPKNLESMTLVFFENLLKLSLKRKKKYIVNEPSISKKVIYYLQNNIRLINKEKELSIFFIDYMVTKPFLLARASVKISDFIWSDLKDTSSDFNYYTKRAILSKIFISSIYFWRKTFDSSSTDLFIVRQIDEIKILGKIKALRKKTMKKLSSLDILKYLDFRHRN